MIQFKSNTDYRDYRDFLFSKNGASLTLSNMEFPLNFNLKPPCLVNQNNVTV